ncbi:zinc-binding alcohol dehydrogenase family protein [Dactylosporangium sucinum]|uniref:Zinc-type alcohol dehydrogenase-like protein n=1 Tax=Dactylosporangium sucinum TaxID=1424081 RepID=A0A917TR34_9ACTN|nr:zinc-binding alcohol dehydrogenase family protein [Dactylosporangium sucinum]GGM33128.1 NADPH:quinone reductase [Dactylosporangium sucinum]
MRAVAYRKAGDPAVLQDLELPDPVPGPRDLLVRVEAVSVNPVDVKVRASSEPGREPKVLGYDAAGTVAAVGAEVSLFRVGDEVYYAGSIDRPGTNSRLHLVDERIAGHKPRSLTFAEASSLPLTTITAWESLFDRFRLGPESTGTLLVLGAAGGVGSMVVQLARALTRLTVVGTASRPESREWALGLGAHDVVDHAHLPEGVDFVFSPHTAGQIETFARILRPGGEITAIDEPPGLDLLPLKEKSITFHWELMFTRPLFETPDMGVQHELLDRVAGLVDAGTVRPTMTRQVGPISAVRLREAHQLVEEGHMTGKVVVAGW